MLRLLKLRKFNLLNIKAFYYSIPIEHQPPKQELKEFQYKFDREFSKDILLNRFNLDLFEYAEIDNNRDCDRVQQLADRMESIFNLYNRDNENISGSERQHKPFPTVADNLSKSGLLGLYIPEIYHGSGYNCMMVSRIIEAMNSSSVTNNYTMSVLVPQILAIQALILGGSESQRRQYLPDLSSGSARATVALPVGVRDEGDIRLHTVTDCTAILHSSDNLYHISGHFKAVPGVNCEREGQPVMADFVVVFAKTSDNSMAAFIIDPRADGVTVESDTIGYVADSGSILHLDQVRVQAHNMLGAMSGLQLARKLSAVHSVSVAASCSGLIRALLAHVNEFVSTRLVFGKPLNRFQVIHYEISCLVGDAYATESVSFYTAGLYDNYPGNDLHCEACLAKIFALDALKRSVDRCYRLLGTGAVTKSGGPPGLIGVLENAHLLISNQNGVLSSRFSVLNETADHILRELSNPKSLGDRIARMLIGSNPKAVVGNRTYVDSFRYNLHQRVGAMADKLYAELHLCEQFLEQLVRRDGQGETGLLKEEFVLEKLASVLSDVFCIIATLGRSSRSISIGLHNQDTEVLVAELQVRWRIENITHELHQLRHHQGVKTGFESLHQTAEYLKTVGGCLQLHQSISSV